MPENWLGPFRLNFFFGHSVYYISRHCIEMEWNAHSYALQCTKLPYTTLSYTTLQCATMHLTSLGYTSQNFPTVHFTTLYSTTLQYTTLSYTTLHCSSPHYTAIHCPTLRCRLRSGIGTEPLGMTSWEPLGTMHDIKLHHTKLH